MQSRASIFCSYDPLKNQGPLYTQVFGEAENKILSLRPVWIIGDLEILHSWWHSAFRKTSWSMDLSRVTLYQHYKQLLMSTNSQSLMLEQNQKPVIQFDLLFRHRSDQVSGMQNRTDCDLHFLYLADFRDRALFRRGLLCLMPYIFSFPEIGFVYLQLQQPELELSLWLTELGFEPVNEPAALPGRLYRTDRSRLPQEAAAAAEDI